MSREDLLTEIGESLFVFGYDIGRRKLACVEIAGVEYDLKSVFLELLDRPIEEIFVVGLEVKLTAGD